MNKIILIGNGFDLHNGYPTDYNSFLNWLIAKILDEKLLGKNEYKELIDFRIETNNSGSKGVNQPDTEGAVVLQKIIDSIRKKRFVRFPITKNSQTYIVSSPKRGVLFTELLTHHALHRWVDIEMTYYTLLKKELPADKFSGNNRAEVERRVMSLNNQMEVLTKLLCEYLGEVTARIKQINGPFRVSIEEKIELNYLQEKSSKTLVDGLTPGEYDEDFQGRVVIVNFNYTGIPRQIYTLATPIHIDIHGALSAEANLPVFGYGDEVDPVYHEMESTDINAFLEKAKSFAYLTNGNLAKLNTYLDAPFVVYIWGHSCGLSDRTLLNYIFEHENCLYIKPFYWEKEDGTDNYKEMTLNISRHFKDKKKMRLRVLNKSLCKPLGR